MPVEEQLMREKRRAAGGTRQTPIIILGLLNDMGLSLPLTFVLALVLQVKLPCLLKFCDFYYIIYTTREREK